MNANKLKITLQTIAVSLVLTGCISTADVSNEATLDNTGQIVWLENALQEEGVFVSPKGPADLNVPAISSTLLVLDGRDVLSVYEFDDLELASSEAYEFSNIRADSDVYLKDALVVVRTSGRDTGLSQTLREIMGNAL